VLPGPWNYPNLMPAAGLHLGMRRMNLDVGHSYGILVVWMLASVGCGLRGAMVALCLLVLADGLALNWAWMIWAERETVERPVFRAPSRATGYAFCACRCRWPWRQVAGRLTAPCVQTAPINGACGPPVFKTCWKN